MSDGRDHFPRKYMTKHGEEIVYCYSCPCLEKRTHTFVSRGGRDRFAIDHEAEYQASIHGRPLKAR